MAVWLLKGNGCWRTDKWGKSRTCLPPPGNGGEQLEDESGLLAATRQTLAGSRVSSWLAAPILLASHSYRRLCAPCLHLLPLRVYLCVSMAECSVIASCPASPVHPLSAVLMRCALTAQ
jgi:hypothetical protein